MLRYLLVVVVFAGLVVQSVVALDLPQSPIQTSMLQNLNTPIIGNEDEWSFDEDDPNKTMSASSDNQGEKSLTKTLLLSAILPGAGEYYLGQKSKAGYFFAAEALTWIGFASFRTYGNWKRDDMVKYASDYANANLQEKDKEFEDWVGFYNSVDEFNEAGRATDDRPFLPGTDEYYWRWESSDQRSVYRDIKNSYRDSYRRADFMIGLAIANRIVSVIDSWRSFRKIKATIGGDNGWSYELNIDPFSKDEKIHLTLYPGF